ncbi:uncharacterized protein SPAPADRAFT_130850 [Spathaspora passalidarum NRRL Y-27907]|uniref:Major facilitator superfamily (MFS) profile domain-containing protein n=1 Tax=Spathaspora passalidarum (strain NRRL Y-27907 / 11-Y1) TaxID=619300 RepID=G3AFB9_SPAPN|nr:uncharacterized protein SPAPADRAFT_130850 [Spathaspora passalidarum NRRL Y-27907]EGW34908.1 hypothetical protein SPAPADRAFT_130850 [Spathaspora passalidarum NRRL Y-27907]
MIKESTQSKRKPSHLGIQQPDEKEVTGTIVMMDDPDDGDEDLMSMKRSATGIILNPQPHESPNDPLNWPVWQRDLCLATVGFISFIGGGQTPLLAAGLNTLSQEFNKPLTTIAYLVGGFMLSMGVGSVFASPTAVLYGKRIVYLGGTFLFMVGAIWGAVAKDFGNLMGARVITGLGSSPTECLPSSTIAEIYYAHERAYRVGLYTMLMLGGKSIIPLISGLIFQGLDRHWLYWILTIALGLCLVLIFVFVPETFWDRTPLPNKRSQEETKAARSVKTYHPPELRPNAFALHRPSRQDVLDIHTLSSTEDQVQEYGPVGVTETHEPHLEQQQQTHEKDSYMKRIAFYSGRKTQDSWWMVALRPFFLYSYPAILYGSFIYSLAVVWLIVISETISDIFRHPPYNYSQMTVGLFYVSPFIGGILGALSCGLISDRLSRYLVSKNHGVYEPEFRLFMVIPSTFFIAFGLMGYGWSAFAEDLWIGPVLFFGSISFGSSMASTAAITFAVDSYKVFAAENLVSFNFLKNLLGFCFSLFNNKFADSQGYRNSFVVYGCIQIFVSLWGIPLYIYGKRLRRWTDEKEIMRALYHVDNIPPSVGTKTPRKLSSEDDSSL